MGFLAGNRARLAIGKFAASCYVRSVDGSFDLADIDTTTLCKTSVVRTSGIADGSFTVDGYWETGAAATDPDALLQAIVASSSSHVWSFGPNGFAVGQPIVAGAARAVNYTRSAPHDGAVEFTFEAVADDDSDVQGIALHDLSAETATSTGTVYDGGAASSNGGAAYLHVTAFSGLTSIAVTIQHATSSGGTYNDLATFTTATGTTSEQVVVAAATTVRQYLRASWTVVGTGSATFTCSFSRR